VKRLLVIVLFFISLSVTGQGIKDSVFTIQQVQIRSNYKYQKEEAGMKESRIDTTVIARNVHLNLSNLLSENSTLYFKDYGRGALSTVSFRGTAPSHTQVSWNGMNINSPMLGMVDFSLVPVYIIDQVNISYGAGSIASRGGGLGGLIEIKNTADWSKKIGAKLYQDYGSFETSNIFAQLDLGNKTFQSKTRIYKNKSLNNYTFPNKNIIETDPESGERYYPIQENKNANYQTGGLSQEFYFRPFSNLLISNSSWLQSTLRSIPTVLSSEYTEESLQRHNDQFDNTIKNATEISYYWSNSKLLFRSGFDFQKLDYSMVYEFPQQASNVISNSKSNMLSWSNQLEFSHDFSDKLSAEIKSSVIRYKIDTYDYALLTGYLTDRLETSVFGGIYYEPTKKTQLSLQLRKDFISDSDAPLIFATGINYKPFEAEDLIFKANVSRNFHTPSLNDLYWQPGGNPNLRPEEGYSSELSAVYSRNISDFSFSTSASIYYSKIKDWIMWLPGFKGYWEPFNVKNVRSYGLEYTLAASYHIKKTEIRVNGNVAITHTENWSDPFISGDESIGKQLPFIPKLAGNVTTSITNRGFYLILQNNSMGMRYLASSNIGPRDELSEEISSGSGANYFYSLYPHYLNKLTLGKYIETSIGRFSLELYVDNLFNETYRNILQRFMPGRSYNIHIKYDL
jgi:outer membrane cobalamin receptor